MVKKKIDDGEFDGSEIWVNKNNCFWVFKIEEEFLLLTEGYYEEGALFYKTDKIPFEQSTLDFLIHLKNCNGYKCVGIAL
jgi:protein involved in ribonucleotide reduction